MGRYKEAPWGYECPYQNRGSEVAVSIFGSAFQGHLVADSYAAYNAIYPKRRQVCLAHLMRKAKEISDRIELMPKKFLYAPHAVPPCNSP